MLNDAMIIDRFRELITPDLLQTSTLDLRVNASAENSIVVKVLPSAYRSGSIKELLLARVKTNGIIRYISFATAYKKYFDEAGIATSQIKSQPDFIRIDLDEFEQFLLNENLAKRIIPVIYIDLFSFSPFGCCSRFNLCSDQRKCLHPDLAYASACQYRKCLETGRIFYSLNKNN